jgi:predicted nucleic acid-binding protein
VLLDTSGLLCLFDASESRHSEAVKRYSGATLRLAHNYIVAEFVALAQARRLAREPALAFAAELLADSEIEIVWVDQSLHDESLTMLRSQLDKTYSLCDAVSFIVMKRRGVSEALTTDGHFDQAGWRRLLPT